MSGVTIYFQYLVSNLKEKEDGNFHDCAQRQLHSNILFGNKDNLKKPFQHSDYYIVLNSSKHGKQGRFKLPYLETSHFRRGCLSTVTSNLCLLCCYQNILVSLKYPVHTYYQIGKLSGKFIKQIRHSDKARVVYCMRSWAPEAGGSHKQ